MGAKIFKKRRGYQVGTSHLHTGSGYQAQTDLYCFGVGESQPRRLLRGGSSATQGGRGTGGAQVGGAEGAGKRAGC